MRRGRSWTRWPTGWPPASGTAIRPGSGTSAHCIWAAWSTRPARRSAGDRHGGAGKPKVGQLPICYDTDRDAAIARAHDQFRWFGGGWPVNSELPGPATFAGATQFVRPEDVAGSIPCGDDVHAVVEAVRPYVDAGFTEVALVQIGGDQQEPYLEWAEQKLLPALREL